MTAQQSKTLNYAFSLLVDGKSYSVITGAQLDALQKLATSERVKQSPGDSVSPAATHVWDIGLYSVCVYSHLDKYYISVIA